MSEALPPSLAALIILGFFLPCGHALLYTPADRTISMYDTWLFREDPASPFALHYLA